MRSPPVPLAGDRDLRRTADAYERAQQARLQTGERIRAAALAQRDGEPRSRRGDARIESLLSAVRQGRSDGPVPALGQTYQRQWAEEQAFARRMEECLEAHPAWPWLRGVGGVGPVLAGRLVGRLDVTRASTPSAFWAYCGLATVPGVRYRCATCGYTALAPERAPLPAQHRSPTGEPCPDQPHPVAGEAQGVRVAQPRVVHGERAPYDRHAKKTCYLIGSSLLRSRGAFEQYFQRERSKLDATRPDWTPDRRRLTALRKMEKLFLAHLWIVWRQALGLPITQPYAHAPEEQDRWSDPWQMVAAPRSKGWTRAPAVAPTPRARE